MARIFICNTNRKLAIVSLPPSVFSPYPGKEASFSCISPLLPGSRALASISKFTFVICHVVFTTMT